MSDPAVNRGINPANLPNGSGAAALLASGAGAFALAVVAIAADQIVAVKNAMVFYKPTGPLSGVTTTAVVVWLVVWAILEIRWRKREVRMGRITTAALVLLALAVLLTFPPIADWF
ncbi:MAG TPA: hypothetical protein VIY53_09170 [Acidobacteriaceae bacterium]